MLGGLKRTCSCYFINSSMSFTSRSFCDSVTCSRRRVTSRLQPILLGKGLQTFLNVSCIGRWFQRLSSCKCDNWYQWSNALPESRHSSAIRRLYIHGCHTSFFLTAENCSRYPNMHMHLLRTRPPLLNLGANKLSKVKHVEHEVTWSNQCSLSFSMLHSIETKTEPMHSLCDPVTHAVCGISFIKMRD